MPKPIVSVLIPAHNEEKVIGKALARLALLRKSVKSFEVLVGLDGCTDRTEQIARSFRFARVFVLNERKGKHAVVNFLLKNARGEICIMNDADLQLECSAKDYSRMLQVFKDPEIGCLADNYTVNYGIRNKEGLSMLYLGDLWNMYFLLEYKTMLFARPFKQGLLQVPREGSARNFFFVNFFRKSLVKEQSTLCDDGERLFDVLDSGKKAALLPLMKRPFLSTSVEKVSLKELYRQKYRGAIARAQIAAKYGAPQQGIPLTGYFAFVMKGLARTKSIKAVLGIFYWWLVTAIALFVFRLFPPRACSTTEGWKLRISR